jgi:hypothetical protein
MTREDRKMVPGQDRRQVEAEVVKGEVVQNIMAAGQGCSPSGSMPVKDVNRAGSSSLASAQTLS